MHVWSRYVCNVFKRYIMYIVSCFRATRCLGRNGFTFSCSRHEVLAACVRYIRNFTGFFLFFLHISNFQIIWRSYFYVFEIIIVIIITVGQQVDMNNLCPASSLINWNSSVQGLNIYPLDVFSNLNFTNHNTTR